MTRSRYRPNQLLEVADGPLTAAELRRLATYIQYRLDRAGEGDGMKFSKELVERFVLVIETAQIAIARPPPYRRDARREIIDRPGESG